MKRMKRLVALLVTIATLASLCVFSIPVSAAELPIVEVTAEDELLIEKLEALGVIDVKYNAASYVTRRQMAEIIVKYMNLVITASEAETPFRDVKTSDSAYAEIRTLYDMGIITGDLDKKFNPDNYVTYDEALVFIINAIGYKMFAVREGGYPTGYHRVAISHGMLKNLSMKLGSDAVKLPDVYKMLEAALGSAAIIEELYGNGDAKYSFSDTETFLSDVYGIRKYRGKISGNEYTGLTSTKGTASDEHIEIAGEQGKKVYETPGYFYGYMLGKTVDYYLKDDSGDGYELKYIEEAGKFNETIRIDADSILKGETTEERIYYKDADNDKQHIKFSNVRNVIYNNQSYAPGILADALPKRGYIEALDNNSDGIYDVLFVYEYKNAIVKSVDTYDKFIKVEGIGDYDGETTIDFTKRGEKNLVFFADSTEPKDIKAITADAVISVMESKSATNKVRSIYISTKTISGTITASDSDFGYLIGEEYYKPYAGCTFNLGESGIFYLDMNNQLIDRSYDAANDKAVYGVVRGLIKNEDRNEEGITLSLFTAEGEFVEAPLKEKVIVCGSKRPYDLTNRDDLNKVEELLDEPGISGQVGEVYSAYVAKYVLDSEGRITSIERATDEAGEGKFSYIIKDSPGFLSRPNGIMTMWRQDEENPGDWVKAYGKGDIIYGRFNSSTSIIFVVPEDGNLDKEEEYGIQKSLKNDCFYRDADAAASLTPLKEYEAYSKGTEATHSVDILLFKGMTLPVSMSEKSMAVIKKITETTNEEGEILKKFYMNENEEKQVMEEITYTTVTDDSTSAGVHKTTDTKKNVTDLIDNDDIKPGSVIIYGADADGVITSIRVIAEYSGNKIHSKFRNNPDIFVLNDQLFQGNNPNGGSGTAENIVIGEIKNVGVTPNTMVCKYPDVVKDGKVIEGKDFLLVINTSGVYSLYNDEEKTVEHLTLSRFAEGDKFIASVTENYKIRSIIVFR